MNSTQARLLLLPTPLDHGIDSECASEGEAPLNTWIPESTLQAAASCSVWICENAKSARHFLKRLSLTHALPAPLQQLQLIEMPREMHKRGDHRSAAFGQWAQQALIQGLAASGLNGQHFAFNGYLPLGDERMLRIKQLDAWAHKSGQTQLCIETPYRNQGLLDRLLNTLRSDTRLAIAVNIGTRAEKVYSAKVLDWRNQAWAQSIKGPAVFMWGPDSD